MFVKSLLRLHRYRKFDYRPRYSSDTKDKIAELRIQKGMESNDMSKATKFKREKKIQSWSNTRNISTSSSSSLRIAIIFSILCFICYIIFRMVKTV